MSYHGHLVQVVLVIHPLWLFLFVDYGNECNSNRFHGCVHSMSANSCSVIEKNLKAMLEAISMCYVPVGVEF